MIFASFDMCLAAAKHLVPNFLPNENNVHINNG